MAKKKPEQPEAKQSKATSSGNSSKLNLVVKLREAIKSSGQSHYAIAKKAGIGPEMIGRFMTGDRDLRLETAAKIAEVLGLVLVST